MATSINDPGLTIYAMGMVDIALQLRWSEIKTINHILKYYPGSTRNNVSLLTKHFYKYPPTPTLADQRHAA